jgi:dimethylaniline monooxygenase (N-oxide forming)
MLTARSHYGVQKKCAANEVMPGFSDSYLLKLIFLAGAVVAFLYELVFYRLLGRKLEAMGTTPERKTDPFGQELGKYIDANTPASKEAKTLIDTWSYLGGNASTLQPCALMKNASFIPNVLNGKIKVKVAELCHSEGKSIIFKDGHRLDDIDVAVVCVGFKVGFPFLSKDDFEFCGDFRKLWKHSVYPKDPTLACVGFARPVSGGVPVVAEMTARLLARAYGGRCSLPKDLIAAAEKDRMFQNYATRHMVDLRTLITSQIAFMDSMAVLVGCQVQPWLLLFTDPIMLWRCYAWGLNPAQYRLFGPHSDYKYARKATFSMERGWNTFKVLMQSIDAVTPFYFPRLVGLHKWVYLSIDIEKYAYGGKPRYPEEVLKMHVMAD